MLRSSRRMVQRGAGRCCGFRGAIEAQTASDSRRGRSGVPSSVRLSGPRSLPRSPTSRHHEVRREQPPALLGATAQVSEPARIRVLRPESGPKTEGLPSPTTIGAGVRRHPPVSRSLRRRPVPLATRAASAVGRSQLRESGIRRRRAFPRHGRTGEHGVTPTRRPARWPVGGACGLGRPRRPRATRRPQLDLAPRDRHERRRSLCHRPACPPDRSSPSANAQTAPFGRRSTGARIRTSDAESRAAARASNPPGPSSARVAACASTPRRAGLQGRSCQSRVDDLADRTRWSSAERYSDAVTAPIAQVFAGSTDG